MTTNPPKEESLAENEHIMDAQTQNYFATLRQDIDSLYDIAEKARRLGLDPEEKIECPKTNDVADRVEELIGPTGIAKRIRALHKQGLDPDKIAFEIADEIMEGKIGNFDFGQKVDRAIRVAMAIKTQGVVSAPLEGINKIVIRQNPLGKDYLSLYFAGPIRNAGGTTQAFAVLVADYVREKMKISPFQATSEEIERMIEEVKLYGRKVNLQYPSTKEELEFALRNLKVELNGDPTEKFEVSAHRNLQRIETNIVRSGPVLVLNDGVLLKSKKLGKMVSSLDIKGWEWLDEIKHEKKEKSQSSDSNAILTPVQERRKKLEEKVAPIHKYMTGIIAGRPVFSHPSQVGGFRLRYGRSRNTGLAACGLNPNTMYVCNEFLAVGTQMKIERPGKAASVLPVTSIEGPVCLLKNGDVVQFNEPKSLQEVTESNSVVSILFLGDILFGYGEFSENNHVVFPSSYVEEWWVLELKKALEESGEKASKLFSKEDLNLFINNPFTLKPSGAQSIEIAQLYSIPLHPTHTFHFGNVNGYELIQFRTEIKDYYYKQSKEFDPAQKLQIPATDSCKGVLYRAFIPHKNKNDYFELEENLSAVFIEILGLSRDFSPQILRELEEKKDISTALEVIPLLTDIKVRDKGKYYMGARMGRPEKAAHKKLKHSIQSLFPLGHGKGRNFEKAMRSKKSSVVDIAIRKCPSCKEITYRNICPTCNKHTQIQKYCPHCETYISSFESACPVCNGQFGQLSDYSKEKINLKQVFEHVSPKMEKLIMTDFNGVEGLTSQFKVAESIEKGILRARNEVWVYNDGTIRYDAIDIPLTHFTPKEIKVPIEKLKEMGYPTDYKGNPLVEDTQICELRCQDFIASTHCGDYFVKVAHFIDDELEFLYDLPRYYNCTSREELIGQYFAGLSPHTSAAIVGRLIGFAPIQALYAHPYWHAAKRRNCLSGDEEIMIWDEEKNELLFKPIRSIVENEIENGSQRSVVDDFGTMEVENTHPNWKIVSIDEESKSPILQPIEHWIKGESNDWIKITTERGKTLTVTPDHYMLVWNESNQNISKTKAMLLKVGDSVPVIKKLPIPKNNAPLKINILKELAENLPNVTKFSLFKDQVRLRKASGWIKQKIMTNAKNSNLFKIQHDKEYQRIPPEIRQHIINLLPSKPMKNVLNYKWYNSVPLSHLEILHNEGIFEWDEIPKTAHIGMARDDHVVSPYIPFNTDLMRLIGYLISEGYIRDGPSCYQINISVPDPTLRAHVEHLIESVLKSIPYHQKDNGQLVHTGRIHAYLFAYAFGIGRGAYSKRIPAFLFALPDEYKYALLSAIIDGDGSIPATDPSILIYSVSELLLGDISKLFNTLGVLARKRKPSPEAHFGEAILSRYRELKKEPKKSIVHRIALRGPDLWVINHLSLINGVKKKNAEKLIQNGFTKNRIVRKKDGGYIKIKEESEVIFDPISKLEIIRSCLPSYCLAINVKNSSVAFKNFSTSSCITANCDGDEDGIMLMLDLLLNFSKFFLSSKIGGKMDAPLVLTVTLNPDEVDSEAWNVDCAEKYSLEFYEFGENYKKPDKIEYNNLLEMDIVKKRLGKNSKKSPYTGIDFTHPTESIIFGPKKSTYKRLNNMDEKIQSQLNLHDKILAVDAQDVVQKMLSTHFTPDIMGNLRTFSQQEFMCKKHSCGEKYRRIPLTGRCKKCGGELKLTVTQGGIQKFLPRSLELCENYDLGVYQAQRIQLMDEYVKSLTDNPKIKQVKITSFFN